jgi:hypothetical protein
LRNGGKRILDFLIPGRSRGQALGFGLSEFKKIFHLKVPSNLFERVEKSPFAKPINSTPNSLKASFSRRGSQVFTKASLYVPLCYIYKKEKRSLRQEQGNYGIY